MSLYKIYGSSAGSGKTFTLTKTFLNLMLSNANPHYFKHILAITFTNDAASEMKQRIIETLKYIGTEEINPDSKFESVRLLLLAELKGIEPKEIQKRAEAAFNQILQDYADFNVKTIDSFVNQLVSSFSQDLGLPYNYEVVLDKEPLLLKAAERVFDKIGVPEFSYISELIENFALEQADEGKNWQLLLPNLAEFAKNLFDDQFYNLIQKNKELKHGDYMAIKKNIQTSIEITKNRFLAFGKKGNEILEANNLRFTDFAYGKSGFGAIFNHLNNAESDALNKVWEPSKRMIAAVEKDAWYSKTSPEPLKVSIDGCSENIKSWFAEAMEFLKAEKPKYLLLKEIRNSLSNLALLGEVKKEFDTLLHENKLAYITDFNRRVNQVIAAEPVPYIYERLGEKYNHILIDEFQDTSDIQYYNLLPLIENGLAKNHFNMLVGDPKQSIYRWRGGKVELMIHLMNKHTDILKENSLLSDFQKDSIDSTNIHLVKESLQKNYRSKQEIIDFNNAIFSQITEQSEEEIVKLAFEDRNQETQENTKTGAHVELLFTEAIKGEEDIDEIDWTLDQLELKISEVLSAGYSLADIAILCRKKTSQAALIAEHLLTLGYDVISADSLLLKNNIGVALLLSLMRAYQDPKNSSKHADAILLYHRYKGLDFPQDLDFRKKELSCWDFLATQNILVDLNILGAFGLYQLAESLANKLAMFEDKPLLPYLFAFFDAVQNQLKSTGNSLSEFLIQWDLSVNSYSVNISKPNAITVSTIHKAKGLEYPVVFVPFANWSTVPRTGSKFWFDLEDMAYDELVASEKVLLAAPITQKAALNETLVAEQYQKELEFSKLEALNILYVAFTRPTDRLYILAKKPKISPEKTVYHALNSFVDFSVDEDNTRRITLAQGINNPKIKDKTENTDKDSFVINKINSRENLGKLKIKSNLDKLFNEQNQRDHGNLIHTLFSEIKTVTDLDQALTKMQFDGLILEEEKDVLRHDARQIMQHERLKHLFSGEIKVENERDILVKDSDISRPDRVVFHDNKITVIDYKTGKKQDAHKVQIQHYGELYRQMGYADVELLLVYLNPTEVITIK